MVLGLMGELEPAVPFAVKHARNLPNQSREFRHGVVLMPGVRVSRWAIFLAEITD